MSRLVDIFPDKGFYQSGETVRLTAMVDGSDDCVILCRISHLATEVACVTASVSTQGRQRVVTLEWLPPPIAPRGYGVHAELIDASGKIVDVGSTAFDVLVDWTSFPRYGFLTDFTPDRTDAASTVEELARFHINGLQFYDWQYRHDEPLPSSDVFDDPLGRRLSLATVRELVDEAHTRGMASMAYIAVYAASTEFWYGKPGWALYDEQGEPIVFGEDFLGLMNPTRGTPWADHLQKRCDEVLASVPFDGIHIDQYGEPRIAFDSGGRSIDLPSAFSDFVIEFKERHPESPTTFNAVKNWPIDELVTAPMDFVYIELWPDTPTYRELGEIVARAHKDSGNKPVVVALYLSADRETNIRIANALIVAHGGSRIELGEQGRLLSDPYFPLHEEILPSLRDTLRRYGDFRIRYGNLLGPATTPSPTRVQLPGGVWAAVRDAPGWITINLVNMSGITEARWDDVHAAPQPITNAFVYLRTESAVRRVWWASPDGGDSRLLQAEWSVDDDTLRVTVPSIDCWTLIAIELESGKEAGW